MKVKCPRCGKQNFFPIQQLVGSCIACGARINRAADGVKRIGIRLKPKQHQVSSQARPEGFTGIRGLIWRAASKIRLGSLYQKLWNPVNYMIVGGIGVGINFLVNAVLLNYLFWMISNFLAILIAFVWNWANSVGPLGHYWGFPRKEETEKRS